MAWKVAGIFHFPCWPACSLGELHRTPYLDLSEAICLEEGNAASPVACGYHLPLWVEGNAVQGLGTGVLEGHLSMDCVPQLEKKEKRNQGAEHKWQIVSAPEPLGVILSSLLPQQGSPRIASQHFCHAKQQIRYAQSLGSLFSYL